MIDRGKRLELVVTFDLRASHSLDERESPHEHVWQVQAAVTGPFRNGRILSLPALSEAFEAVVAPLRGTYLNENPVLDSNSRKFPTCECLAHYFERAFSNQLSANHWDEVMLTQIEVAVQELDGQPTGKARLSFV